MIDESDCFQTFSMCEEGFPHGKGRNVNYIYEIELETLDLGDKYIKLICVGVH